MKMFRSMSFSGKIGLSFVAVACLSLLVGGLSIYGLQSIVAEKDRIIEINVQNLVNAVRLQSEAQQRLANHRAYLLMPDQQFLDELRESRVTFGNLVSAIRRQVTTTDEERALGRVEAASNAQRKAVDGIMELRTTATDLDEVTRRFQDAILPANREFNAALDSLIEIQERQIEATKQQSAESVRSICQFVIVVVLIGFVVAIGLTYVLGNMLRRQIGLAVQHIQSSSNELQAAANQQSTGSREQATSTNEIAATVKELVATARQISESAQRVANIAEETARGARSGDGTMQNAQDAVVNIQRQVELIVSHMLELGSKSQQIGGILEIINEMSEQTNILAINASIEAVGAGESGRRFGVVADEIRKLADRVGNSTKDIKSLIEDIRSAVHTTVMATEAGSKAAEAGSREFGQVSSAFQRIVQLVETTTEASREIELSTKQQTTAVEQVNVAIANVAHAAKESEISSVQTLQTISELTSLSRDLSRLIQPQMSA